MADCEAAALRARVAFLEARVASLEAELRRRGGSPVEAPSAYSTDPAVPLPEPPPWANRLCGPPQWRYPSEEAAGRPAPFRNRIVWTPAEGVMERLAWWNDFPEKWFNSLLQPFFMFDPWEARMIWANPAGLEIWRADSVEELASRSFADMSPERIAKLNSEYQMINRFEAPLEMMTFYPKNRPTNVLCRRHGILLPSRPEGPPVFLIEAYRPDKAVDPEVLRGIELLKELDVIVTLYDANGTAVMRNPTSVRYFGPVVTEDEVQANALGSSSRAGGGPPTPLPLAVDVVRASSGISAASSGSAAPAGVFEPVLGDRFLDPRDREELWELLSSSFADPRPRSATPESGRPGQQLEDPPADATINRAVFKKDVHCATLLGNRWLSFQCKRYVDPATGKIGFLVSARDVTEKYLAEKELVRAREAAEAANKSKSSFLANMSHELRTPLAGIFGIVDMLRTTNLTQEQESAIDTLHSSSAVLLTLLNDILDLSKIEAGQLRLERITFDLHALLGDVRDLFAAQMASKGLRFEVLVEEGLPGWVVGDPTRTRQSLYNIVGNAGKFTEAGGVRVTAHRIRGGVIEFAVSDTGIGIPEDKVAQLFQPFVQADVSTTRRFGGTGLGLAIVSKICQIWGHGSEITVRSTVGVGSTFVVRLWLPETEPPAPRVESSGTEFSGDGTVVRAPPANGHSRSLAGVVEELEPAELIDVLDSAETSNGSLEDPRETPTVEELARSIKDNYLSVGPAASAESFGSALSAPSATSGALRSGNLEDEQPEEADGHNGATIATGSGKLLKGTTELTRRTSAPKKQLPRTVVPSRILLAEDNRVNQMMIKRMLEKIGHAVVAAVDDGLEAVRYIESLRDQPSLPLDLILLDGMMPNFDGIDATRAIRAMDWGPQRLPIVVLTADALAESIASYMSAGPDAVLTKPVNFTELNGMIEKLVLARRAGKGMGSGAAPR